MARSDLHILALETSSQVCDVALLSVREGLTQVLSRSHGARGEHAERLLPMVDELLAEAELGREDLSAIAFGQGPGGFTGLRVACGVAQGMAFALGLPVVPVVSLHAAALLDPGDEPMRVVAQDARMGEVYAAAYGRAADPPHEWHTLHEPTLLNAADVAAWIAHQAYRWTHGHPPAVKVVGDALEAYPQLLSGTQFSEAALQVRRGAALRATAEAVARLALLAYRRGHTVPPHQAAPLYVRDKVAYTSAERTQGHGGNPKAQPAAAIRPMRGEDVDGVVEIECSVQAFPWTKGNFQDALKAGYEGWVACRGERVVGFCVLMFAPDVAHLLLIAVRPDEQRKGVGYQLLRHCEARALARGLPAVLLEVRPSNRSAVAFYINRGFRQMGTRKGYYPKDRNAREDAWVMEKQLAHARAAND